MEELAANCDMVKLITCMGCDERLNVRQFVEHCGDCRLAYNIPRGVSSARKKKKKSHRSSYFKAIGLSRQNTLQKS